MSSSGLCTASGSLSRTTSRRTASTRRAASASGVSAWRPSIHLPSAMLCPLLLSVKPRNTGRLFALLQPRRHLGRLLEKSFDLLAFRPQRLGDVSRDGRVGVDQLGLQALFELALELAADRPP